MPDFPEIGCYAVAQYPSSFELNWPLVVQTAVDGSEQRFAPVGEARRIWQIQLESLRESDASRVWGFFRELKGQAGSFRFQDPWTQQWHDPCWFDTDDLAFTHLSEGVFQGELRIVTKEH